MPEMFYAPAGHSPDFHHGLIGPERRGFVFQFVIEKEFICCLLDRFPLLFAGFLFDDLAVALL